MSENSSEELTLQVLDLRDPGQLVVAWIAASIRVSEDEIESIALFNRITVQEKLKQWLFVNRLRKIETRHLNLELMTHKNRTGRVSSTD